MPTFRKKSSSSTDGSTTSSSSSSSSGSGSSGSDSNTSSSDSDSSSSADEKPDKVTKPEAPKEIDKTDESKSQVLTRRKSAESKAAATAAAAAAETSLPITIPTGATQVTGCTDATVLKSTESTSEKVDVTTDETSVLDTSSKARSMSSLGNLRASRSSITAIEDDKNTKAQNSVAAAVTKRRSTLTPLTQSRTGTPAKGGGGKASTSVGIRNDVQDQRHLGDQKSIAEKSTDSKPNTETLSTEDMSKTALEVKPDLESKPKTETDQRKETNTECGIAKPDPDSGLLPEAGTSTNRAAATIKSEPSSSSPKVEKDEKPMKETKGKAKGRAAAKKDNSPNSSAPLTAESEKDEGTLTKKQPERKRGKAPTSAGGGAKAKGRRARAPPKRNAATRSANRAKSSESESASAVSGIEHITTSASESEASESSNSYGSRRKHPRKSKRTTNGLSSGSKMPPTDSDDVALERKPPVPRVFTRTINTRRCKRQLKQCNGVSDSDSDLLAELEAEKRALSKSPAKKSSAALGAKAAMPPTDAAPPRPREPSPPETGEKKCSVEGCDSSGHLGGVLEHHFLREACPLFHNMTAEECRQRARERKYFDEEIKEEKSPSPVFTSDSMSSKSMTSKQMDFLERIRESRATFKAMEVSMNGEKVNGDKASETNGTEESDDKREPSLVGLVPDYDLQLFRDAQALAAEKIEEEVKDLPVGKGIKYLTMGKYKMKVWYQSPYPDDAALFPQMFICEFCLRNQKSEITIKRHALKCLWRHPPGDEIYRKGKLQVWQVDGRRYKVYCQQLCLLAKFFLDHKTLYYDVEPFLFYIMTLADSDGCHIVGYFSKEKNSFYNVSCILTLPPYQRKGYGRLLIDFSYLLTRVEGKIGSPEKPLSDLGLISYRSYWKDVLLDYLCNRNLSTLSIKDVSQEMAIYSYDIVSTLQALGMMKYWKGKHIVLKKQEVVDEYEERLKRRGNFPKIDKNCLRWTPFVPAQANNIP